MREPTKAMSKFELYRDPQGFRWRFVCTDGRTIAASAEAPGRCLSSTPCRPMVTKVLTTIVWVSLLVLGLFFSRGGLFADPFDLSFIRQRLARRSGPNDEDGASASEAARR